VETDVFWLFTKRFYANLSICFVAKSRLFAADLFENVALIHTKITKKGGQVGGGCGPEGGWGWMGGEAHPLTFLKRNSVMKLVKLCCSECVS